AIPLLAACAASQSGTTTSGIGRTGGGDAAVAAAKPVPLGAPQGSEIGTNGVPVPQAFDPTRSVILTANIAMRASDPWATAEKAQSVAIDLGGDVIGLNESGGKDDRVASLTLRVPSLQFTEAPRRLRALVADVAGVGPGPDGDPRLRHPGDHPPRIRRRRDLDARVRLDPAHRPRDRPRPDPRPPRGPDRGLAKQDSRRDRDAPPRASRSASRS